MAAWRNSAGEDNHPAARLFPLGDRADAFYSRDRVVDDFAVDSRHRLESDALTGLLRLLGDLGGKTDERLGPLLAVAADVDVDMPVGGAGMVENDRASQILDRHEGRSLWAYEKAQVGSVQPYLDRLVVGPEHFHGSVEAERRGQPGNEIDGDLGLPLEGYLHANSFLVSTLRGVVEGISVGGLSRTAVRGTVKRCTAAARRAAGPGPVGRPGGLLGRRSRRRGCRAIGACRRDGRVAALYPLAALSPAAAPLPASTTRPVPRRAGVNGAFFGRCDGCTRGSPAGLGA